MWEVEFTDEFGAWWEGLAEEVQESIAHDIGVLEAVGPGLGRPRVDTLKGSRHGHMKELRTRHKGSEYRTIFAFDPRRCVILLIGGDKRGVKRFYEAIIARADDLYDEHLAELRREGLL